MLSDKTFTLEEFKTKVPEFAQALINKCADRVPGVKLHVKQESPVSYLITIENGHKSEHYQLTLNHQGKVESESVYMV